MTVDEPVKRDSSSILIGKRSQRFSVEVDKSSLTAIVLSSQDAPKDAVVVNVKPTSTCQKSTI